MIFLRISKIRSFVFAIVASVSQLTASAQNTAAQELGVGSPAPKIDVSSWVKGAPVNSFKEGNIYVVEFWATWCGPCKRMIPVLTSMAKDFKGKVTFIGVSVYEQDTANVAPFVRNMGDSMDYHVAIDDQTSATARTGFMATHWMGAAGQDTIPTAFIVGKSGRLDYIGPSAQIRPVLDQILAGSFDVAAYATKQAANEAARKLRDQKARAEQAAYDKTPMGQLLKQLEQLYRAKKFPEALALSDEIAALPADSRVPRPRTASLSWKEHIYLAENDADGYYRVCSELIDDLAEEKDDWDLNQMAWYVVDPNSKLPKKDYDFAIRAVRKAIEVKDSQPENWRDTLAWAYFGKGDRAAAIKTEQEALEIATKIKNDPNLGDIQKNLKHFGG